MPNIEIVTLPDGTILEIDNDILDPNGNPTITERPGN